MQNQTSNHRRSLFAEGFSDPVTNTVIIIEESTQDNKWGKPHIMRQCSKTKGETTEVIMLAHFIRLQGMTKNRLQYKLWYLKSSSLGVQAFVNGVREANSLSSGLGKGFDSRDLIFRSWAWMYCILQYFIQTAAMSFETVPFHI